MIPPYDAFGVPSSLNGFKIPEDDHVIVSLHSYLPYGFALAPNGSEYEDKTWGTDADREELENTFDYYYYSFVSKGIPVVVGEFASIDRDNTADRVEHAKAFVSGLLKRNMACLWFDTRTDICMTGLFDRNTLTWVCPEVKDVLINTYKSLRTKTISINSTVNSWDNGFTINMVLKNETDSDINGWSLKIKKSDLTLTQCWNAEMTEYGDYIILKSEEWNSTIPAGETISIGGVGTGTAKSDFEYEIIK